MLEEPGQIEIFPEMIPGVAGTEFTVTASVVMADDPQPLFALTVTIPPDEPAVAEILVLVDVPDHPPGNVHVYEVA